MKQVLHSTGAALALACAALPATAAEVAGQPLAAQIDAAIAPLYKANGPGASIIVVKDGKTVFRKAYGMADLAGAKPMTPDMPLRIGSMTKQFTSTAILMLADEGKLSLDDDITKFFPDYPTQGKKIKIEHLLTHTSGIFSYSSKPNYSATMARDFTVQEMIDGFKNEPMESEPGTKWRYNNSGYYLLGAIIEKVSGQTYAQFVESRIFAPLGMKHSGYEGASNIPADRPLGYEAAPNGYRPAAPVSVTQMYAAGALVSTVDDLARWDAAVSSGKLLRAATWQRAFTNYRLANGAATGYGYGWEIGKLRGVDKLSHGGRTNGFQSYAMRLPAEKVYVAVLSNGDSGVVRPDFTAFKAAAAAIGKPLPGYKAMTLDAALLDTYAGVYKVDDKAKRSFKHVKDTLVMQRTGGQPMPLTAFSQTGFFVANSMIWVEFKRDAKGEVSQAVIHDDEDDTANANERIGAIEVRKPVTIAHIAFDAHSGRYQLGPMVIEISREGERFFAQPAGQKKLELFALSDDKFFATDLEVDVTFDTGPNGEQLTLSQNGREMKGKKLQ